MNQAMMVRDSGWGRVLAWITLAASLFHLHGWAGLIVMASLAFIIPRESPPVSGASP